MTSLLKRAPKLALCLWALAPHTKSQAVCQMSYHDCLAPTNMDQDQNGTPESKDDRALMQQWLQPNLAWISEEATSNKIAGFGVWVAGCIPKEVVQKSLCNPAMAKPFFDLQDRPDLEGGLFALGDGIWEGDRQVYDSTLEKDANTLPVRQTLWCTWNAPKDFWPKSKDGMIRPRTTFVTVMLEGHWTRRPLSLQKREELCSQMVPIIQKNVRPRYQPFKTNSSRPGGRRALGNPIKPRKTTSL
jgi:hypothetical protein